VRDAPRAFADTRHKRVLWDGHSSVLERAIICHGAAKAGLGILAAMDAAITSRSDRYEKVIAGNESVTHHQPFGGVPTFVFEREPFFGQEPHRPVDLAYEGKGAWLAGDRSNPPAPGVAPARVSSTPQRSASGRSNSAHFGSKRKSKRE